uniref:Uncharacterized protein n=1 Tax=Oryza nivara TaxID=4536 RepID=A0A0E0GPC1_ORYNI
MRDRAWSGSPSLPPVRRLARSLAVRRRRLAQLLVVLRRRGASTPRPSPLSAQVLVIHIQFKLIRLRAMIRRANAGVRTRAQPARSSRAGNADAARAVRNRAVCTPTVCLRVRFRAEEIELPLRRGAAAACGGSELPGLPRSGGGGGGRESRDGEGDGDADAASGGEGRRRRKEESGFHCSPPVDCAECSRGSG